MQKYKKLFGVLLSVLMILSAVSVGLVAMAQEPDGAVSDLEAKITAFNGNMDTATPTDADKAAYDELVSGFKALTDDQKNSIDIVALDKLTQEMYKYQQAVEKEGGASTTNARKNAAKFIVTELNAPDLNAAQAAVDAGIIKSSTATDTLISLFKDLSPNARAMAGTAYSTYGLFYYSLNADNNYVAGAFYNVVNELYKDLVNADPFEGKRPTGTTSDPAYVEALREYNLAKEAHEYAKGPEAIKQVVEQTGATEYADIVDFIPEAIEAIKAFEANKDYTKAVATAEKYDNMTAYAKSALRGMRLYAYSYMEPTTPTWTSTKKVYVRDLAATVNDYARYENIQAYETFIAGISEPYTMEIYEEVAAKYAELPQSMISELSAEALAKTEDVFYFAIINTLPVDETQPDVSGYQKTAVTYPSGAPYDKVTSALPKMDTLIQQVVSLITGKDLKATINGLYTNATLGTIASTLYTMLGGLVGDIDLSGITLTIDADLSMAAYCEDIADIEAYNGAIAHLTQMATDGQTWEDLKTNNFVNGDFFVETGDAAKDKEAFLDAFATFFRPFDSIEISVIIITRGLFELINFENVYDFETDTYTPGIYENIATIFEALGIDCMDSISYSEAVYAAETDHEKMDARFRPILASVFDLIDQVGERPMDTILTLLPNLARALNTGLLNTEIQGVFDNIVANLGSLGGLVGGMLNLESLGFDFSASGLFNTIGKLGIEGITFTENADHAGDVLYPDQGTLTINIDTGTVDAEGNAVKVPLTILESDFIQFCKDMEGCGTLEVVESIQLDKKYTTSVAPDKADAFVTLVRFVYDDVLMKNMDSVKTLISATEPTVGSLRGPLLDVIKQVLPADSAIVALVTIADPLSGVGDIGGGLGDIGSIFDKIRDFFSNLFNGGVDLGDVPIIGDIVGGIGDLFGGGDDTTTEGTEQTGDPDIPTTGSVAGAVTSAVALAAGAAIVLGAVKARRSREEDM